MRRLSVAILVLALLAPLAFAHVPVLSNGGDNITSATAISDPAKSWAIYGTLEPGKARYYSFEIEEGQRIYLSLLTTTSLGDTGFSPSFALIGQGIQPEGELPGFVEAQVPQGYGAIVLEGNRSEDASYEPFGPGSYYSLAKLNLSAPESGKYYVALYNQERGGNYSLAVGYEETSTLQEKVFTPLKLISIYTWSGQSLDFVLAPLVLILVFGIYRAWKSRRKFSLFSMATELSALFFFGWGAVVLVQILYNSVRTPLGSGVVITLALVAASLILGLIAAIAARSVVSPTVRFAMFIIGAVGLVLGFGLVAGPVLAIAASVLPSKKR